MPTGGRPTLTQFLIEQRRRHPGGRLGVEEELEAPFNIPRRPAHHPHARERPLELRDARLRLIVVGVGMALLPVEADQRLRVAHSGILPRLRVTRE